MISEETFNQIIENGLSEEFISTIKEMCENFGKDYDVPAPKIEIIRLPYPTFKGEEK